MGKKGGTNSKAEAANAKKAAAKAEKDRAKAAEAEAREAEKWSKGAKGKGKKDAEAEKKVGLQSAPLQHPFPYSIVCTNLGISSRLHNRPKKQS